MARHRTVTITMYDKRRVQPETIEAVRKIIESGEDHGMIAVDQSELGMFDSFQINIREVDAMSPPPPRQDKTVPASDVVAALEGASDDAIRNALAEDGPKGPKGKR